MSAKRCALLLTAAAALLAGHARPAAGHPGRYVIPPSQVFLVKVRLENSLRAEGIESVAWCVGAQRRPGGFKHVACSAWYDWDSTDSSCFYYHAGRVGSWSESPEWWMLTQTSFGCKVYAERYL